MRRIRRLRTIGLRHRCRRLWITDILRKRIGYRNLIVSDDLEMGGVLSAAPIGEAAVEFIRAGGDLCLVCHREDYIVQAYEALIRTAGTGFEVRAARCGGGAARTGIQEKERADAASRESRHRRQRSRSCTRRLWEFGEEVRLDAFQPSSGQAVGRTR